MLTKTGPKLLDFGLAKGTAAVQALASQLTVTSPLTTAGTLVGTFQYMAPEQLEGREADERSDLFRWRPAGARSMGRRRPRSSPRS
jgi:serine/threonine-protein kinase